MKEQVNFRIETDIKNQMEKILHDLGLNMTTAINLFAHAVIRERGIPFDLRLDDLKEVEKDEMDLDDHKIKESEV